MQKRIQSGAPDWLQSKKITAGYTTTFDQCTDLCATTPECVDVTYHRLEPPDTVLFPGTFQCDLESTIGPAIDNRYVCGAKQIASTDSATTSFTFTISSSSLASPSLTPSACPSSNGTSYTAKIGATYSIGCSISYTGTFLTTLYSAPDPVILSDWSGVDLGVKSTPKLLELH